MSKESVDLVRRIYDAWDPRLDGGDGLAVRFRWFNSHREALEAAGL